MQSKNKWINKKKWKVIIRDIIFDKGINIKRLVIIITTQ